MPLHEYECKKCGHRFEKIQKFSDEPIKICPKCAGEVEQLLSAPAVRFKGAGWYVNDYAKKGSGAPKNSSGEPGSTSAASSSSESKSESAAESKPAAPATSEKKSDK